MSAAQKYASQAVEDLQGGAGLADNFNGTITAIQLNKTPPHENYKFDGDPIFSHVTLIIDGDTPIEERTVPECYTLGGSSGVNFTISEDGYGLIPVSDESGLRKDSKWATVLASLAAEGGTQIKSILQTGDLSKLIGLKGAWKRVADKERSFASTRTTRPDGKKKFPPSTLVCTKIIALPGVNAVTSTATASSAPAGDVDAKTGQYLAAVVKSKGGKVQRSQLLLLLATAAKADTDKQAIAKRGTDEAFLNAMNEAGGVVDAAGDVVALKYDGTVKPQVVTLAA